MLVSAREGGTGIVTHVIAAKDTDNPTSSVQLDEESLVEILFANSELARSDVEEGVQD